MEPLQPLNPISSSLRPRSISTVGSSANSRSGRENAPPMIHPNVHITRQSSATALKKPYKAATEPPGSDAPGDESQYPSDSSVKVVVRVRPSSTPVGAGVQIITDVSSHSLSIGNGKFTFDSVLGPESSQEDVFKVVGVPLVRNALAGYNASIVSHGLTGSGKTYTMWGPQSAMLDAISADSCQGIVPRIFQMLFSEIHRKQECLDGKQISYQCRCSFLEIYNERINDLLDPTQRNLQIRDDAKNGLYVENLTDEYVNTIEDVTQILVKNSVECFRDECQLVFVAHNRLNILAMNLNVAKQGLSNRKVGATTINSKSSRSHIIFTCIIESWCKGTQSVYFSNSKISRISLVDLAGLDSNRCDGVRKCVEDGRQVKQSLRKLGRLVKTLSEAAHSGEHQKIVYMGSCLTHLLKESLGGNTKVTYICAISPEDRAGTLGTLRFGDRVKCIQNEAVINEITEDAVNGLTDQIRQLKEELISTKSKVGNSAKATGGYFKGHSARDSLNQLRVSLNRSLILPAIDVDSEEVDVDENDVNELCTQLQSIHSDFPVQNSEGVKSTVTAEDSLVIKKDDDTDASVPDMCDQQLNDGIFPDKSKFEQVHLRITKSEVPSADSSIPIDSPVLSDAVPSIIKDHDPLASSGKSLLSIIPCRQIPPLHEPTISESPKFGRNTKKCITNSSDRAIGKNVVAEREECNLAEEPRRTLSHFAASSLQSSKACPTESLAASLHRGLQIIDYHQRNSASRKPVLGLSFEHFAATHHPTVCRVDAAVQTSDDDGSTSVLLASACEMLDAYHGCELEPDDPNMQIIQVSNAGTGTAGLAQRQVVKDRDMILTALIKREKELQTICAEQAAEMKQLNHLVYECKAKHEQWSTSDQDKETKLPRIEGLADGSDCNGKGNVPSSDHHHMLSNRNDKDHHEVPKGDYHDLKEGSKSFDFSEKEALLVEIQSLKDQLNSYTSTFGWENDDLHLRRIRERPNCSCQNVRGDELELERERQRWTESESQWICLTEELRIDLESNRRLAEKKDLELSMEKKFSAELDDALHRAIVGHARIVEHYVELQEKHDCLLERHRKVMEGIAEVKKAAKQAGTKGAGSAFAEALAAELSTLRVERERERAYLKAENKGLKIQLRDTAEAVHAAGELLVRLREAEEAVTVTEEKYESAQKENEKLRRQMEKLKRKHAMEMTTMKHYLAESRLPESALEPLYRQDSECMEARPPAPDDHSWQAAFRPAYE